MKKLLCLFSATLLVFASCSNDDNNSSKSTPPILVKKITEIVNGKTVSRDYLYDGNKIVSFTESDGSKAKYTYTGDFITKIEDIDDKGVLNGTTEYSYTNGKLTSDIEKYSNNPYHYKTKYIHNADGTVSYEQFRIEVSTGKEEEYGAIGKYTYKAGNLVKLEVNYYGDERSYVYEYDTKNSPFKNITGFSLLLDEDVNDNNVVKETGTSGSGANIHTTITTYTYEYDANNYPTEMVKTFPNGTPASVETTLYVY